MGKTSKEENTFNKHWSLTKKHISSSELLKLTDLLQAKRQHGLKLLHLYASWSICMPVTLSLAQML